MFDVFASLTLVESHAMLTALRTGDMPSNLSQERFVALYDGVNSVKESETLEGYVHNYSVHEFFDDVLTDAFRWYAEFIAEQPEMRAAFTFDNVPLHRYNSVSGTELLTLAPKFKCEFEAPESYVNQVLPSIAAASAYKFQVLSDDHISDAVKQQIRTMYQPALVLMSKKTQARDIDA